MIEQVSVDGELKFHLVAFENWNPAFPSFPFPVFLASALAEKRWH